MMEMKGDVAILSTEAPENDIELTLSAEESTKDHLTVPVVSNGGDKALKRLWNSDCEENRTTIKRECLHSSILDMCVPNTLTQINLEGITTNGTTNSMQISNLQKESTPCEAIGETTSKQISPIEKSVDLSVPQLPPWERYFTKRIVEDICLLIHSNRIAVVTLLPSHPILSPGRIVTSVDFAKRADNTVSGKGKRGGQALKVDSALCEVSCSDNTKYTVRACIGGKLIEVNTRLMKSPQLLTKRPQAEGYIAIILPYDMRNKRKDKKSDNTLMETQVE